MDIQIVQKKILKNFQVRNKMIEKYKLERTYRGYNIYNNSYCLFVTLGERTRYFHAGGNLKAQEKRCIKEVDDFLAGRIE